MGDQITRWVEPCAGMLAVGLWLRGKCDPPIAYLGGKRGYRAAILDGLGVRAGSGCRDLWIADAGPAGAFWRALVKDGEAVCARLRELAETREPTTHEEARETFRGLRDDVPAEWLVRAAWAFRTGQPSSGLARLPPGGGHAAGEVQVSIALVSRRAAAAVSVVAGAHVYGDARAIPVEVAGRTVVLLDPPYVDTTGYAAGLSRDEVAALARAWADAGAEVLITEREPVVPGWPAIPLYASGSQGSARGAWEYLTMSPNVRWEAGVQGSLFAEPMRAPGGSAMTGGVGKSSRRRVSR